MTLSPEVRSRIAECVIGLSLCGAGYHFLVAPLRAEATLLRREAALMTSQSAPTVTAAPDTERIEALGARLRERLNDLKARSLPAADQAELFTRVNAISDRFGLRIERLNASERKRESPTPPPAGAAPNDRAGGPPPGGAPVGQPAPKDTRAVYEIAMRARYADLPALLTALRTELGYCVVRALRVQQPSEVGGETLTCSLEIEVFGFDGAHVADALASSKLGAGGGAR